jgi:ABC-type multidrug transport system permease subunit
VLRGWAFTIMLVAMYGLLVGGAIQVPGGGSYMEFLMPGMFVMTMAFGIGETMSAVSVDAERGVTDRIRTMPMPSGAVVLGRSVTDMLYAVTGLAVLFAAIFAPLAVRRYWTRSR